MEFGAAILALVAAPLVAIAGLVRTDALLLVPAATLFLAGLASLVLAPFAGALALSIYGVALLVCLFIAARPQQTPQMNSARAAPLVAVAVLLANTAYVTYLQLVERSSYLYVIGVCVAVLVPLLFGLRHAPRWPLLYVALHVAATIVFALHALLCFDYALSIALLVFALNRTFVR